MLARFVWAAVAITIACGPTTDKTLNALGASAKIVMIGDSITRGYDCSSTAGDTVYNGYRSQLDTNAIADGYTSLQWLGQQNNSTASYVATRHHEGINGDSANDKLPTGPSTNGAGNATNHIDNYLGVSKALHGVDVAMVFLCTNGESGGGTFAVNYKSMMEQIRALEPQIRFVVNDGFSGSCTTQNANLTAAGGIWDQLEAEGITLFRAHTTLTGGNLCDTLHPNAAGYTQLGNDVYPALKRALRGN